jgi:hypothetical protein
MKVFVLILQRSQAISVQSSHPQSGLGPGLLVLGGPALLFYPWHPIWFLLLHFHSYLKSSVFACLIFVSLSGLQVLIRGLVRDTAACSLGPVIELAQNEKWTFIFLMALASWNW